MGRFLPNLVLVRDSGLPHVEFRVQCEVRLSEKEANDVEAAVIGAERTRESIERAREMVLARVDPKATHEFRQIINLAFTGQPEYDHQDQNLDSVLAGAVANRVKWSAGD
jgi:hypothetical protein